MSLSFPKVNLKTRIKQFFCKHDTISKGAFTQGINAKEGYNYVVYICRNCNYSIGVWEKKEDW